ncbi:MULTISPECIES: deaminase [unclassified Schlesneria]|uniref:deaminase n=1 Tax=Schlesneria TaxID=656899 RepID=UPI00359F842F
MARLVIGITGPIGSGVSTVADAFEAHGFKKFRISDVIRQEKARRLAEGTYDKRHMLQDIGNEFRAQDPSYWVKQTLKVNGILHEGEVRDRTSDLVIDSIRNLQEAKELMHRFAPNFFLIAVQASKETRWNRLMAEYQGDQADFDRDDARDTDEELDHGQQVDRCVQFADYVVLNEDDKGGASAREKAVWSEIRSDVDLMRAAHEYRSGGTGRAATSSEVAMAIAYAQSHQSACLKRFVGAAIVGENGMTLAVGYNENPTPMMPCKSQYGFCYKDSEMEKSLDSRRNVHCPKCGTLHPVIEKPYRCSNCLENLKLSFFPSRNMEICTAIHAEERAIRSLGSHSAKGATLYCTTFPCFQCARYIVDAGIRKVVYVEAYPVKQSLDFLRANHVTVKPFHGFKARAFNLVFRQIS